MTTATAAAAAAAIATTLNSPTHSPAGLMLHFYRVIYWSCSCNPSLFSQQTKAVETDQRGVSLANRYQVLSRCASTSKLRASVINFRRT